jgi:hypothetical protein
MSDLFIWIYSVGGGAKLMKHFMGALAIKVREPVIYTHTFHRQVYFFLSHVQH